MTGSTGEAHLLSSPPFFTCVIAVPTDWGPLSALFSAYRCACLPPDQRSTTKNDAGGETVW